MNDLTLKKYGNLKSFGNKSLQQNMELVKDAISQIQPMQKIFDRQHSQFQTRHFIVGKQETKYRAVRQICAEIQRKESALLHNLHKLSLKEIDLEQMQENLQYETNKFTKRRLSLEIEYSKISIEKSLNPIQGCLRDILILKNHWDSIYEKMTEAEIEYSETEYWILRLCNSGIRDIRINNRIGLGVQLALQNIGINPLYIQIKMQKFIQKEMENPKPDLTEWHKALSHIIKEVIDVPNEHAKIKNLEMGVFHDGIYQDEYET